MTVQATSGAQSIQGPQPSRGEPPPPPALSTVQQGDVAAGRLRVAEGQVFSGTSTSAPATSDWGNQPPGSGYREAFDSAAGRLGTRDGATVGAEIDRQLYSQAPAPAPAPAPAATPAGQPGADQEGVGSFIEGAIKGDFGDNKTWSATAGQVVVGFIPVVGQIADIRDTAASIGQVIRGEEGGWVNLGAAAIGWIPGVGDAAKAAIRVGNNVADAGVEVAQGVARHGDEVAGAATDTNRAADAVPSTAPKADAPKTDAPSAGPANGVPASTIAETAARTGIPESKIREILDMPKKDRPDPIDYIPQSKIDAHLQAFRDSGAIRFTTQTKIDRNGTLGPPGGTFTIPASEFQRVMNDAGGDLAKVEDLLQLNPGELTNGDTVIAFIKPENLDGLRIPRGNELGAFDGYWVPGGFTGRGIPEAVIDTPAGTSYTEVKLGE